MKKITDKHSVAHLWAHQSQDEARNSGGNFYFHGDTIYSYGSHFPIARHATNKHGERAVLFTTRGYSNTTAKHISVTRGAVSHMDVIYVQNPSIDIKSKHDVAMTFGQFERAMRSALEGLGKARKKEKYIEPAKHELALAEAFGKFVGVKVPKTLYELMERAEGGKYAEYLQKEDKRIERKRVADEKKKVLEAKKSLAKWRSGKQKTFYGRLLNRDYLRIGEKGRIETSQGVVIPQEAGKRAFNWIKATLKSGGCAGDCKYKILEYEVNELSEELLEIGCHKISIEEINKIAKKLNWMK